MVKKEIKKETIGARVKRIRKSMDMTLEDLQNRSGVTSVTLSGIEHGKDVRLGTIQKIEVALGVQLIDVGLN